MTSTVYSLCIPFTFGANSGKKGTTEKQIFYFMRGLQVGRIEKISSKKYKNSKGINVITWFVHFSTWNADDALTTHLDSGNFMKISYDDHGHYWKVFKYTPKLKPTTTTTTTSEPKKKVEFEFGFSNENSQRNPPDAAELPPPVFESDSPAV